MEQPPQSAYDNTHVVLPSVEEQMSIPLAILVEIQERYKLIGQHFSIADERKLDKAPDWHLGSITRLNLIR